ncbi:MAG: response regulator [Candidatus Eisenbacteria bacterium]|nr:response regulator [Candidatus Eisenbacteria bacterium]MCC7144152.1 response regulator [Candidatus Eisenbacteria bacterium]
METDTLVKPEKILVVEDEPSLRLLLRTMLENAGYTVRLAEDGQAGLEAVTDETPDLILLDVMMPRMDGYELCRRLKSNYNTSQIPIIMLTAKAEADDRLAGLNYGANDYLAKPYEQRELLVRVRNLLQWGKVQRDANPLTGLPGNHVIERELSERIAKGGPFVFMYLDIDNFKAFNDFYSYQKGDQALRLCALILRQSADRFGVAGDFVGHIGGDDFVLILSVTHAREIADEVIRRFDAEIPELYSATDRARGYIQVVNRQGELERYGLMTLTIAAVSSESRQITHVAQVSDIAAQLKHYGKEQRRSIVVWERRGA